MAQPAQKTQDTQDTPQDPPRSSPQAALKIAPQATARKTRAEPSQETPSQETPSRETRPRETETVEVGAEDMANAEALDVMIKANEAILHGMAEVQREVMAFGNARLREDIDTQDALSCCADLREAFQVQADFAQKAMQQYTEETAKLLSLSAKVGRDCWGPFEDATRAAFKGVKTR